MLVGFLIPPLPFPAGSRASELCQNTLGHRATSWFELAASALPPEHTLKLRGYILDFPVDILPAHLAEREQRIVEREAMPAALAIPVLLKKLEPTGQTLPLLG
jgi:hypothetical protein